MRHKLGLSSNLLIEKFEEVEYFDVKRSFILLDAFINLFILNLNVSIFSFASLLVYSFFEDHSVFPKTFISFSGVCLLSVCKNNLFPVLSYV